MDTTGTGDDKSPRIVITGQGKEGAGRLPTLYARAVELAGGRAEVSMPFDELRAEENLPDGLRVHMGADPEDPGPLDGAAGLLLPGGGDIDPVRYGAPRHPRTRYISPVRDRYELLLLDAALKRDMPVLCICRGFQLLNVHLGGTLDQHLADNPELLEHDRDMPRAEPAHTLRVAEDSMLADVFGQTETHVNSHHHQGLEVVASSLTEVAWAGDGVLEAVVSADHSWVLGVQWHPEVMAPVDHVQARLFERFVAASQRYASAPHAA